MGCSGGCLLQGASALGGVYIPACTEADPPPVDRQMPVKILPWPNFVAAGNKGDSRIGSKYYKGTGLIQFKVLIILPMTILSFSLEFHVFSAKN